MNEPTTLQLTVGQVARRVGVSARTVRFWSDEGLVEPLVRSSSGYRTYDAAAVARLDLVRTLRELGLGLAVVRELLERRRTVAEIAAEHVRALDAELRVLRLRRALLHHLATATTRTEELRIVHELATLSARERQQSIDASSNGRSPEFRRTRRAPAWPPRCGPCPPSCRTIRPASR